MASLAVSVALDAASRAVLRALRLVLLAASRVLLAASLAVSEASLAASRAVLRALSVALLAASRVLEAASLADSRVVEAASLAVSLALPAASRAVELELRSGDDAEPVPDLLSREAADELPLVLGVVLLADEPALPDLLAPLALLPDLLELLLPADPDDDLVSLLSLALLFSLELALFSELLFSALLFSVLLEPLAWPHAGEMAIDVATTPTPAPAASRASNVRKFFLIASPPKP